MSLDRSYLEYPHRHYGMDHDRYTWSMLSERPPVHWPGGRRLAVWVNVCLQFFPLNQQGKPFPVPGGMTMPYPDLRHYTLRDYGNRVGIFRVLKALDRFGIRPTFAVNARLAERLPWLMGLLRERGDEILCHGWHMDALHYGGQSEAEESEQVARSLDVLRQHTQQDISGWLSPARNESARTPDLLAANGVRYFCDWVNDDMPYRFSTGHGPLWALPLSNELEDRFVLMNNLHSEQSWVEQVCDACDFLLAEAADPANGGRMLGLNIHPWLLGQPHRIGKLEALLGYISSREQVWFTGATPLLDAFEAAQPEGSPAR